MRIEKAMIFQEFRHFRNHVVAADNYNDLGTGHILYPMNPADENQYPIILLGISLGEFSHQIDLCRLKENLSRTFDNVLNFLVFQMFLKHFADVKVLSGIKFA